MGLRSVNGRRRKTYIGVINWSVRRYARVLQRGMSYTVALECGCVVYVSCDPATGVPHTRVLEYRALDCRVRSHDVGARLDDRELRAQAAHRSSVPFIARRAPSAA